MAKKNRDIIFKNKRKWMRARDVIKLKGGDPDDDEKVLVEYKKIGGYFLIHRDPKDYIKKKAKPKTKKKAKKKK